jgi:hypothetical protein
VPGGALAAAAGFAAAAFLSTLTAG